jgi:hypothetical protein
MGGSEYTWDYIVIWGERRWRSQRNLSEFLQGKVVVCLEIYYISGYAINKRQQNSFLNKQVWSLTNTHGPINITSRSAQCPLTVRSVSAHGPLTVRSRSAHGPLTVRSVSAHGPLELRSLPVFSLFSRIEMGLFVSERCHESDCCCRHTIETQ